MRELEPHMKSGKFLTFAIGSQLFGLPINHVLEINQLCDITSVPNVPTLVRGVINLRGKVVPVIDLRLQCGRGDVINSRSTSIISIMSHKGQVGVIVDDVKSVVNFLEGEIELAPEFESAHVNRACFGIGKVSSEIVILLDLLDCMSMEYLDHANLNVESLLGKCANI